MNTHTPTVTPELRERIERLKYILEAIKSSTRFESGVQRHEEYILHITAFEKETGIAVYLSEITNDIDYPTPIFVANEKVINMPVPELCIISETQYKVSEVRWTTHGFDGILWALPFIHTYIEDRSNYSEPNLIGTVSMGE
ncbi:hypothetical protein [Methanococcoides methylutens]|uniref:hypothetical protein n=1 Tax=Methanococcoides methylutens TaxID=2226 RepID=UPI00064EE3DC|nr:hypothetical protein [Methanococcoides methylutens]